MSERVSLDLLMAYCRTTYFVETGIARHSLRLGERNDAFDRWCESLEIATWAFVTSANPRSQRRSEEENAARDTTFRDLLRTEGRRFWTGAGVADKGDWPAEPSLLVADVSHDEACAYGRRFDQHAIVWGVLGGPAELVLLSPVDASVLEAAKRHGDAVVRQVVQTMRATRLGPSS